MKNIAVLVSGGGTNLQALIDAEIPIALVISSKPDAYALERAAKHSIKTQVVEWAAYKPDRTAFSREILRILQANEIDLVVCAGFMLILDKCLVEAYPNAMINVHPALLPAFGGAGYYGLRVHAAVLASGAKLTGATVHFVTEGCDEGPIILQETVEVKDSDSPESLQERVMLKEREILPKAVKAIINKE
ncbi:MAG: phosphoribosylglycinamide formyltransferase [Oscillospiraceae bacterium]|nr:phosphoribosylglycinamide formyltransferase [Oscillospiraceae bacterium]